ncbi:MAG TPA: hypothetical protein VEY30_01530, partial [Myxococcaceae bacterium]|nr:hypothetical protein [Myxococcaceae bacterium]
MRLWKLGLMGFIGFAGLTAGCSDEGGASTLPDGGSKDGPELPPEIPGLVEIRIDPADQAVEVNGVDLQRLQYKAIGKFEDGREEDITSRVAFSHEPVIGTFQGPELQLPSDRGGQSKVTVSGRGSSAIIQGTATISVSVRRLFNDPASTEVSGDPAVVAQKFTGAND